MERTWKAGRKPTGRKRSKPFSTLLTEKEFEDLTNGAKSEEKTQADYIMDLHYDRKPK